MLRSILLVLFFLQLVASIRVPAPHYAFAPHQVWDSTASCLKNSTQTLWNSTQEAYARLRQHRAQCASSSTSHPSTTDDVVCHTPGVDDKEEDESLTEYLTRLEQRLTKMEQERAHSMEEIYHQQQYILALQQQQREQHEQLAISSNATNAMVLSNGSIFAVFDTIRLFIVTAMPVVLFGTLLGLGLIGFTHLLGLILEICHPLVQSIHQKTQKAILVSAQFVVDLLERSA
mmetsp:Transcript_13701/g.37886  ORF Transcript_13701/g.37886 Transcript_13701/m.37886 type:complete len:231 (+) Transcript_13701:72-764(+)